MLECLIKESRNGIGSCLAVCSPTPDENLCHPYLNYSCRSFDNKSMSSYFHLVFTGHCYGVVGLKKKKKVIIFSEKELDLFCIF